MELSRRTLLWSMSSVGLPPGPASPASRPGARVIRAVRTTGISHRILKGDDSSSTAKYDTPAFDDGCKGLELYETYFGTPEYVGPYLSEDKSQAVFKKRTPSRQCIFRDGVSLNDIHQGRIGDCWFLSAIDFSIRHPKYNRRLQEVIKELDPASPSRACRVTLYDLSTDTWQHTVVGPHLLLEGRGFPTVVSALSSDPDELWPSMVEKGLAKMCRKEAIRGYEAIGGGWMSEAMCFLHGRGNCYFLPSQELLPAMLHSVGTLDWFADLLQQMLQAGYGVFVIWDKAMFRQFREGLVANHAYSVLSVDPGPGQGQGASRVTLKNPWGRGLFKPANGLENKAKEAGVFDMDLADVLSRAAGLDIYEPLGARIMEENGIVGEALDSGTFFNLLKH